MTRSDAQKSDLQFRPLYPRDVDVLGQWNENRIVITDPSSEILSDRSSNRSLHHPLSLWWQRVSTLALPNRPRWSGFVATLGEDVCGMVDISPFNRTRSTWQVNCVAINPTVVPAS
ncbi:MAG: N-acetyltransferase, partial [Leptolyngbya sp. SIO1D8]|nr:N-acetyltransferase [Leptolyngbya sp. SIO1D8]